MAELTIFLLNDQPTTCPYCGARAQWVDFYDSDGDYQVNLCLQYPCAHIFLTCDDEEFVENDWSNETIANDKTQ